MAHSATTAPTITPVGPSAAGSIGGFEVTCPACGFTFRSSLRTIAEVDAREHVAYMLRKERATGQAVTCAGCETCDPAMAAAYAASLDAFYAELG